MTKTHRDSASTAETVFHKHYSQVWGEERWQKSLYPALEAATRHACSSNRYTPLAEGKDKIEDKNWNNTLVKFPAIRNQYHSNSDQSDVALVAYVRDSHLDNNELSEEPRGLPNTSFPPASTSTNGLQTHWNLDAASLLVVQLLDAQPGDHVLDLCAAPGGKSIAIAQTLFPHLHADNSSTKQAALEKPNLRTGTLRSNEPDPARHRRLAENLRSYLPKQLFDTQQVIPLRIDGSKPNAEAELRLRIPNPSGNGTILAGYNKVLVDAPCSSERHIIHAHARASGSGNRGVADEMANWRPGSSKRLAKTQAELLMMGLRLAKVGGTVVYATCSIETLENDGVVEKVLGLVEKERKKGAKWKVRVESIEEDGVGNELESWAERTKYGWIVLPDHPGGGRWGPLFFAKLTKIEVKGDT